ncbi:MAG: cupin domain-containing protein [Nitrospiraceae bacterium]
MIASTLASKKMVPMYGKMATREPAVHTEYSRHAGEEFIFVIAGTLEMRFENGTLTRLETGD